jgi:beta propeller repeat protein
MTAAKRVIEGLVFGAILATGCGPKDTSECSTGLDFPDSKCEGDTYFTCVDGAWKKVETCDEPLVCDPDVGCQELDCTPDATFCEGNGVMRCDTDGWSASVESSCDTDEFCENAECSQLPCENGSTALDWQPLPQGVDCGPGCRQLTFKDSNTYSGWAATHRYVAYTASDDIGYRMHVIDVDRGLEAVVHPGLSGFSPDIKNDTLAFVLEGMGGANNEMIEVVDLISGATKTCLGVKEDFYPWTSYVRAAYTGRDIAVLWDTWEEDIQYPEYVDIYTIDGARKTVFTFDHPVYVVRADGDYAVWEDGGYTPDIWAHRISTGETWNVTDHPSSQWSPQIDGTRVVWADLRNGPDPSLDGRWGPQNIYMHDFATGETTRITSSEAIQGEPDISGDRIVWTDSRACPNPNDRWDSSETDIWLYDLETKIEHRITTAPGAENDPRIDGGRVFYVDYYFIFMQELSALGL